MPAFLPLKGNNNFINLRKMGLFTYFIVTYVMIILFTKYLYFDDDFMKLAVYDTMKKVILFTLFCTFLFILPTIAVGAHISQKTMSRPLYTDWTILEGRVTGHRHVHINGGDYVEFNCFFVHYRTHYRGNIRAGWFHHFDRIVMPELHMGFLGNRWVFAKFFMSLIP